MRRLLRRMIRAIVTWAFNDQLVSRKKIKLAINESCQAVNEAARVRDKMTRAALGRRIAAEKPQTSGESDGVDPS
jgi:hypothetical protein